jgi:chromosome segregation ATPase
MSLEAHHQFILNTMQRHDDIARKLIQELEAENARLKAEVERLTDCQSEADRLKAEVEAHEKRWAESEDLISHYKQQRDEAYNDCQCHRLKAEVERLRKAGDELSWAFAFAVSRDDGKESGLIKAWNAAKEGKQS